MSMETKAELLEAMGEALSPFQEQLDEQKQHLETLHDRLDRAEVAEQKAGLDTKTGEAVDGTQPLLALEQKAAPHFERFVETIEGAKDVRVGALLAAIAGGQPIAAKLRDVEQKALLEMTGPAGGYLVPEAVGSIFIDAVRPRTRVLEAGARTYPMEAPTVHLPGWDTRITAAWRGEGQAFTEPAATFRQVTLQAKSVAAKVTLSVELFEDAGNNLGGVASIIESELGNALAEAVDYAALFGTGIDAQPLGIANAGGGLNSTSMGGNGATPTDYDKFLDAMYETEADAFENTAVLLHPRTLHTLAKIKTGISGDLTKLAPPPRFAELRKLPTTQVPINLTVGSNSDCSTAFFGDWSRLVIGFRPSMAVRVQTDPYSQSSNGQVVILAYLRADVGLLNREAFSILTGIRAA